MAQENQLSRVRVTNIGLETTFGVAPAGAFPEAYTRIVTVSGDDGLELVEEMLEVGEDRSRRIDPQALAHGLQVGSKISLTTRLKATPSAGQLTAAGTAGSYPERIFLKHALGVEHAAIGTTCSAGWSTTTGDVASAANLEKGDFILITISGEPEWTKITNISGSTLTVSPALSGAPATSAVLRQLYNYVPANTHSNSVAVQRAYAPSTTAQVTLLGCHGDISFDFPEFGKMPSMTLTLSSTTATGPTAQSISTTPAADAMGAAFTWKPSIYLATAVDRATRMVCESPKIEFTNNWQTIADGGASQCVGAVVNTGGHPRPVKLTLRTRFDTAWVAAFDADTAYQFVAVQKIGTGTTASFWIFELPRVTLAKRPDLTTEGDLLYNDLEFTGLADAAVTVGASTGEDLDRIYASLRVAFG